MKKMWTAVTVVGLIAAVVAIGQEVTSVNAVGFNKIKIGPQKRVLLTPTFESFGDSTIVDLVGDQLPTGSRAWIFNRVTQSYASCAKLKGGWSGSGATNVIFRGDAFWLYNGGTTTNEVAFMGEVPYTYNDGKTSTVYSIQGYDGVGYAYPVDVIWTNTTLSQNMTTGDRLFVWDDDGNYASYARLKGGWATPAGLTIPAGRAFFVYTPGANIDWEEIAPYDL